VIGGIFVFTLTKVCFFRVFGKVYAEWLITIGTRKRSNRHYHYYDVLLLKLNFAETMLN